MHQQVSRRRTAMVRCDVHLVGDGQQPGVDRVQPTPLHFDRFEDRAELGRRQSLDIECEQRVDRGAQLREPVDVHVAIVVHAFD